MEVDALGAKGKGKGKKGRGGKNDGKGKSENPAKGRKCHNCGRTGHFKRDCWPEGALPASSVRSPPCAAAAWLRGGGRGRLGGV